MVVARESPNLEAQVLEACYGLLWPAVPTRPLFRLRFLKTRLLNAVFFVHNLKSKDLMHYLMLK